MDSDDESDSADEQIDERIGIGDAARVSPYFRLGFQRPPRAKRKRKRTTTASDKSNPESKETVTVEEEESKETVTVEEEKSSSAPGSRSVPKRSEVRIPTIREHRHIRDQLQFLVQHPGSKKLIPETEFVFDRPDILDAYLGNLVDITGHNYTDRGWVYNMKFEKHGSKVFQVPATYGEEYEAMDRLWHGSTPLSSRGAPNTSSKKGRKKK